MRLLIITQKVDANDDNLGFFHGWLEKFAENFEKIITVCLERGQYKLPANVKVLSLGKEQNNFQSSIFKKTKYLVNFYKYIWRERNSYDAVFVHMNQEYVILGGIFWKLFSKRILMWRNHLVGGFFTKIAVFLSDVVFYTSPFAFVAMYKKAKIMPVGIDTEKFQISNFKSRIPNSILYLGRISPIKKLDVLMDAFKILKDKKTNFNAKIIGNALKRDRKYYENLKQRIDIEEGMPNYKTPEIYNQYEIFVNLTPAGSMDKTIFEAMACGCLTLVCNRSLNRQIDKRLFFKENDAGDLAFKLEKILSLSNLEKQSIIKGLRDFVVYRHNLNFLIQELYETIHCYSGLQRKKYNFGDFKKGGISGAGQY